MKISKDHLIQQEAFFVDSIRDSAAIQISSLNYGLLAPSSETGKSINIKISIDPSKIIRVNLLECNAINNDGERIEISTENIVKLNSDLSKLNTEFEIGDSKEKSFYVVIMTNIFARNPIGKPDASEVPPRYPFVAPQYTVEVLPESQISNSSNSLLVLGKIETISGRLLVSENYIPPCTLIKNHPKLLDAYYNLGNKLGEVANFNISIIQKIHAKSQTTSLVKSFTNLSDKVSDFLADNLGRFMWILSDMPPVYMMETFIRLAYLMKFSLERLPPKDKEELLSYFSEWTDYSIPEINEKISAMLKCQYNHDDINESLLTAENFVLTVHTIFSKLNSLDFIGKKKGERAFVQERTFTEEKQEEEIAPKDKKNNWSFLAD
jgi:hypothetical protein